MLEFRRALGAIARFAVVAGAIGGGGVGCGVGGSGADDSGGVADVGTCASDFACQSDPDADCDCDDIPNGDDNCVREPNPDQDDEDRDGYGDACDGSDDDDRSGGDDGDDEEPGPWDSVATGGDHSCGIASGHLYCWGLNSSGQVGTGSRSAALAPARFGAGAPMDRSLTRMDGWGPPATAPFLPRRASKPHLAR